MGSLLYSSLSDRSFVAGGIWHPNKNQLEAIKNAIMKNPKPLRDIINHIEFNELRASIFAQVDQVNNAILAQVDQMNNAPNGVNKNHPDQYTGGVPVAI
ncbi:hypothetical protein PGTUg99_028266 [Puccinia graminis f. sp. tritici]|nr:hypothetical protein PGTUg99_028266 [Puccinia graminis f. sp. tritici]